MKSIDSYFKHVSKRTFNALQNVHREKARDAEEEKQKQADLSAQIRLAEMKAKH